MINPETLIEDIKAFVYEFGVVTEDCVKAKSPGPQHLVYFNMVEAWNKLQNVVEREIKPML